jgi:hypothetical protein
MAQIKGKQLRFPISGSFTGSLYGTSSWAITASYALNGSGGGGSNPGGSDTQVQFNNNGVFGGIPTVFYSASVFYATGSFYGLINSSSYSSTASYYQEVDPIFVEKSASLATTGSNTFIGTQVIVNDLDFSQNVSMSFNEWVMSVGDKKSIISPGAFISKKEINSNTTSSIVYGYSTIESSLVNSESIEIAKTTLIFSQSTNLNNEIIFQDGSGEVAFLSDFTSSYLPLSGGIINGELVISGSAISTHGFTGSLHGTSSWSEYSVTSSYITASNIHGPYGINSIISASHAATASSADTFVVRNQLTASGLHYPVVDNGIGSFIQTDGSGSLTFQYVKTIYEEVKNRELVTIPKGAGLYVEGNTGNRADAYLADAYNPNRRPATLVAASEISPNGNGLGIVLGLIDSINVGALPAGTDVFLSSSGQWTSIRPTGADVSVQYLGTISRTGVNGAGYVLNPGPYNLPNIVSGSIWVGDSGSIPRAVATSSLLAPYVTSALTSSMTVLSSSFASTASLAPDYVLNSVTASMLNPYVLTSVTSSMSVLSSSYSLSSSYALTASYALNGGGSGGSGFPFTGSAIITGSLIVTGSVNFNDNLLIGSILTTSSLVTTGAGSTTILTRSTGSYGSMFVKYVVLSGSNSRAGEFMTVWSGVDIRFTDFSTSDIGNTNSLVLTGSLSSSNVVLSTSPGSGWIIKTQTTFI